MRSPESVLEHLLASHHQELHLPDHPFGSSDLLEFIPDFKLDILPKFMNIFRVWYVIALLYYTVLITCAYYCVSTWAESNKLWTLNFELFRTDSNMEAYRYWMDSHFEKYVVFTYFLDLNVQGLYHVRSHGLISYCSILCKQLSIYKTIRALIHVVNTKVSIISSNYTLRR